MRTRRNAQEAPLMKRSTARWTTAMATAALIVLPAAALAQASTPQTSPSQTSPAQTTPTPTSTQGQTSASSMSAADHVREAKQALAGVPATSIPAASRAKLGQLRAHLNKLDRLVATSGQAATSGGASSKSAAGAKGGTANWGTEAAAIDKLASDLEAASTDDTAKQKLTEVRRHITELASSMSGTGDQAAAVAGTTSPDTTGANPSAASQQSTPTAAAANPTPSTTDPTAAGAQTYPAQPPAAQPSTPQAQVDAQAAKQHLSEARDALAQLTSLPEAAKLQGEARTQVSQLI